MTPVTGVETAVAATASVSTKTGVVEVTVAEPTQVAVYDLSGRVLYSGTVPAGTTSIQLAAKGVVLVKAGAKVAKIAM